MANLFKKTIKIPRYGIIAIKYLIETRDLKGLILIANKKISNNINPEIKWFIRSEIERVKKIIYSPSVKLHFITFYTQGGKYDDGIDLSSEVDLLLRKAKPFADSVRAISAYELKSNPDTKIYVKEFEEEAIWNFKTNKIGFLRWNHTFSLKN